MPTIPSYTKCSQLGCNNPRSKFNSCCIDHGGRDKQTYNPKYNQREDRKANGLMYKTKQWEVLRRIQLSKQPLCAGCMADGMVNAANVVDHLFPWTHISKEAFFINKFQSLCPTHHSEKTQLEQHGIYRRYGAIQKDFGINDYASEMGVG
jgi:5-methylcytosine-specific restriction enzyme A